MTSPEDPTSAQAPVLGEVERVPLKVVPIFVQPIEDELPAEGEPSRDERDVRDESAGVTPRRRTVLVALAALLLALGTIAVHVAAIVVASAGDFAAGTLLGYLAIGLSVLTVLVSIGAVVVGRLRLWAVIAASVAVLANPLVLLIILRFLSGLSTA